MTDERRVIPAGQTALPGEFSALPEGHGAIAHLADELLPALIAKLTASGLGEIEVREGGWKARLRMPPGADERSRAGRGGAGQSHQGHGHGAPHGASEGSRRAREDEPAAGHGEDKHAVATSPAVGVYHPRRDLTVGMRVRAGDRIGSVDVLGIREEVVAPLEGVIGASLAESGEAVEYGQELVRIELPERIREAARPEEEGGATEDGRVADERGARDPGGRRDAGGARESVAADSGNGRVPVPGSSEVSGVMAAETTNLPRTQADVPDLPDLLGRRERA